MKNLKEILAPEVFNKSSKSIIVPINCNGYIFKGCFRLFDLKISNNFLLRLLNLPYFINKLSTDSVGSIFTHTSVNILKSSKITIPKIVN